MRRLLAAMILIAALSGVARAEDLAAGISRDKIEINSNFTGTDVVVFGAIENELGEALPATEMRDVVVVIRSDRPYTVTVRKKERVGPIYVNRDMRRFADVPGFYFLSSTRPLKDIAAREVLDQFELGLDHIAFGPAPGSIGGPRDFRQAIVRTKQRHEDLREPVLLGFQAAIVAASVALIAFGAFHLYGGRGGLAQRADSGKYWVPVVLGIIGLLGAWGDLGYILRPRPTRMAWWYKHMENMLGVGIAFHTAFLVFGANRLIGYSLPSAWALLPWAIPSAIGIPATQIWVRYYKRRFGELDAPPPASAHSHPEEAQVG